MRVVSGGFACAADAANDVLGEVVRTIWPYRYGNEPDTGRQADG